MSKKNYFYAALWVVLASSLFFLGIYAVAVLLLTAILTYCFAAFDLKHFIMYCVLSVAVIFFAVRFNIVHFALFSSFVVLVSSLLGYGFYKNITLSSIMTAACTAAVAVVSAAVVYLMNAGNKSAFNVVTGTTVEEIKTIFQQAGANSLLSQDIDVLIKAIDMMLPSVVIIIVCFGVYAAFGIARYFLERSGFSYPGLRRFSELRLGRGFTMVFCVILFSALLFDISGITLNIISVVSMLYVLCGLSYIDYRITGKITKKSVRILIYVSVYIVSFISGIGTMLLLPGLMILGIADSFKDLRNLKVFI